jgi:hypothetical protein
MNQDILIHPSSFILHPSEAARPALQNFSAIPWQSLPAVFALKAASEPSTQGAFPRSERPMQQNGR